MHRMTQLRRHALWLILMLTLYACSSSPAPLTAVAAYADDVDSGRTFEVKHTRLRYVMQTALVCPRENFCLTFRQKWVTV